MAAAGPRPAPPWMTRELNLDVPDPAPSPQDAAELQEAAGRD